MSLFNKKIDQKIARDLGDAPRIVFSTAAMMEELVNVLMTEIELIKKKKMKEHAELLKRKQRLTMDYRANMKSIAAHPDVLKKLPSEAKDAMREEARRLAQAVETNALMLRSAMDATRQLVQNAMAKVRSEALAKQTYKNHAKAHLELGNYSPTCRPVAVSRTV